MVIVSYQFLNSGILSKKNDVMNQDEVMKEFLSNELKDVWQLIIDNDIEILLKNINQQKSFIQSVVNILSLKKHNNILLTILNELFKSNTSRLKL